MERVLVVGFGPFMDVTDNPAARLARAVDGAQVGPYTVVGRVMPVSYRRAPEDVAALIEALSPVMVIGIGVARGRAVPMVERFGHRHASPNLLDVDREALTDLEPGGPERVESALAGPLAAALELAISEDAGDYVCNAWIYRVCRATSLPTAFIHVPDAGLDPARLLRGLERLGEGNA